jgi:hypothetical protein
MPLPPKPFHVLNDLAVRWSTQPIDIVGWCIDGLLKLASALPPVRTASWRMLSDVVEIAGSDVLPLFRPDGARLENLLIRRVRVHGETEWQWISEPLEGVAISAPEVLVTHAEVERFERQHRICGDPTPSEINHSCRPEVGRGSGAPPRYNWNAFAGAVARRIHDQGMPASQGELIRDMLDWFGTTFGAVPDESTVRRRVQALWPVLTNRSRVSRSM